MSWRSAPFPPLVWPWASASPGKSQRDIQLIVIVLVCTALVFLASAFLADTIPWAPFIPLGIIATGLGAWLVLAAALGSPVAIMVYFSALAFMTNAQFRVRGAGEMSGDWQSALKFLIWIGAGVVGYLHMPPLRVLLARPGCACLLAYICMALASSIYSPVPGYSFGCALALLCLFAFSFSLTTRITESQLLWTLLITLTIFNIGGWFVFFAIPDLGTSAAWTTSGMMMRMCGLAGQATNLGAVCAKAIGAAFILWYTHRCGTLAAIILGGFALATLIKSDARTTEIAAIAGVGAILASRSLWLSVGGMFGATTGLLLLQFFPNLIKVLGNQASRSGDPTEVYTLTGRLEIWDFAWSQILRNPILGYGYNSSKVVLGSYMGFENGLMVDSAHNLYLQNLLSVGALGMIPLVILLIYIAIRCIVHPIPIVVYMFVLVLISSISDTDTIGTTPSLMTVLFFIICVWPGLEGPGYKQHTPETPAPWNSRYDGSQRHKTG